MKIKKIERICKKRGAICLFDTKSIQWLGDGYAIYPLNRGPYNLEEKTIYAMFDLDEKKQEKIYFRQEMFPESISIEDSTEDEVHIEPMPIRIIIGGLEYAAYKTSEGIRYVNVEYFAPIADEEEIAIFDRGKYIAIKSGLLLVGIIIPHIVADKEIIDSLDSLSRLTRASYENYKSEHYVKER